jgi:hypothetical protein
MEKSAFNENIFLALMPNILKLKPEFYLDIKKLYSIWEPINKKKTELFDFYLQKNNYFRCADENEKLKFKERDNFNQKLEDFCQFVQLNIDAGKEIRDKIKAEYSL